MTFIAGKVPFKDKIKNNKETKKVNMVKNTIERYSKLKKTKYLLVWQYGSHLGILLEVPFFDE